MVSKRWLLSFVAVCVVCLSIPLSAHAYKSKYARNLNPTSLTFMMSGIGDEIDDDMEYGVIGVRWTQSLESEWALVTQAEIGGALIVSVGANYYIYGDMLAFYVSSRLGGVVASVSKDGTHSGTKEGIYFDAGLGLEYNAGHFVLRLEASPAFIADELGYRTNLGLGGRF